MAQALVLGATGHIGAHVARALLADGHQVRAAYHNERWLFLLDHLDVERVWVDLEDTRSIRRALEGCEWIFHAAGYYPRRSLPRDAALSRGIESMRRIIDEWLRLKPSRVVVTSSAATIQHVTGRPATEEDAEPWPSSTWRSLYASVKIAMEHEVLHAVSAGLPAVIVNPSICLGEYDAHAFSGRLVLAFAKHRLPFYLDHQVSTVYTGDVGRGQVLAARRGQVGARYLLSGQTLQLKEVAQVVAREAGVAAPRWRLPHRAALIAAWGSEVAARLTRTEPLLPRHSVHAARHDQSLDGSKAVRELGLTYTSLEEAVRRALVWFRQHGYC